MGARPTEDSGVTDMRPAGEARSAAPEEPCQQPRLSRGLRLVRLIYPRGRLALRAGRQEVARLPPRPDGQRRAKLILEAFFGHASDVRRRAVKSSIRVPPGAVQTLR